MSDDRPTPRREFLGKLATSAVVLTGAACASPAVASQGGTAPAPARSAGTGATQSVWDDSWFAKLTGPHKAVFDSPGIEEGNVTSHASGYLKAVKDVHGVDGQAVIVIRHMAIPMAFNNVIWEKYDVGKTAAIKRGADFATQNPYAAAFKRLTDGGAIILCCDLATRNFTGKLATAAGVDRATVYEAVKANLLPGAILQPTGVYAFLRAQEAGCSSIRSTI